MAESNFQMAHKFTAEWEGGITNHPADRGGVTAYGASFEFVKDLAASSSGKNLLQSIGVSLPVTENTIRKLTRPQVEAMFRFKFWDGLELDRLPFRQALLLYDCAVNTGKRQGVKLSQRGYNRCVSYGEKLVEDGLMGPKTRAALQSDTIPVTKAILQARRKFYEMLAEQKPTQKVFLKGWLNRVNALERLALGGLA